MKERKAPLPAPPFYKGCYVPRAERSPDRRYSPYPPPSSSKDGYYGKNAGSWALSPNYYQPPSDVLRVNWINKEQYITEMFAAMEKHSVWSMHASTRPQFGPNVSAEYVLDPVFKDVGLDMSVYGYLLPLLGHKVASAAEAPNSAGQVGTTTGYWQRDGSIEVPVGEVAALKISEN
ncbi:hypothetical protein ZWY2020_031355 [Hordeum vulgare]|nr:hypothetical protein ZWY2020_031355 [Hordeum vulgare]